MDNENGGVEFRFGVCKREEVDKEQQGTYYHYRIYTFEKKPEYADCAITLRQVGNETRVVLTAGRVDRWQFNSEKMA